MNYEHAGELVARCGSRPRLIAPHFRTRCMEFRSEGRTKSQHQELSLDGDGAIGDKSDGHSIGTVDHCRSTLPDGGSGVEQRAYHTQSSRFSRQRDTTPLASYAEDVGGGFGKGGNKEAVEEGEILTAITPPTSTALLSPCHSARSRSLVTRRHQLAEPRSHPDTIPAEARGGGHRRDRGDYRTTHIPGTGKPRATSSDCLPKHEGGVDSVEGAGGSQARGGGWWSSTSRIDPCGKALSKALKLEGGFVSTLKSWDGNTEEAAVGREDRGTDWETLLGNSVDIISGGDEHTQAVSKALARAEALAR